MSIDDKEEKKNVKKEIKNPIEQKYKSLVTQDVLCNKRFSLVKGEVIPKGIDNKFIQSLISSNLIK